MKYKEYTAIIDYDEDLKTFHGRVIAVKDVINFYGSTPTELEKEFKKSVDNYLEFCKKHGKKPDKPFSGEFIVRTSSKVHRAIAEKASQNGLSLNKWVEQVLYENAA